MITYTTKQGDMWDSIAHTQCGDALSMDDLIMANQQYADYYIFPAGITLYIPETAQRQTAAAKAPPWKKVAG